MGSGVFHLCFTPCPYYFWSWGCSNSLLCLHIVSCCRHSVLMINCDTCCDYQPSGGTCWKPTDRKTKLCSITAATSASSSPLNQIWSVLFRQFGDTRWQCKHPFWTFAWHNDFPSEVMPAFSFFSPSVRQKVPGPLGPWRKFCYF